MSTLIYSLKNKLNLFRIKLLIIFLFWTLTFIVLASCMCVQKTSILGQIEYDGTDAIIKGRVIYMDEWEDANYAVFKVEENYKPDNSHKVLKVKTPKGEESCGLTFELNETWLIYAYKADSIYTTSKCARSMKYIDEDDYKQYNDRYIDHYHKNLLFLKSKLK